MVTAAQAYWLNRKRRRARNEGVGVRTMGIVLNRVQTPNSKSASVTPPFTTLKHHYASGDGDVTDIRCVDVGWYSVPSGAATLLGNDHTVKRFLEYPVGSGVFHQFKWSGATSVSVPDGGVVKSDVLLNSVTGQPLVISKDDMVHERTVILSSGPAPSIEQASGSIALGIPDGNVAADRGDNGSISAGASTARFGATAFVGAINSASARSFVILSDSIGSIGSGDVSGVGAKGGSGWPARFLDRYSLPYFKIGGGGVSLYNITGTSLARIEALLAELEFSDVLMQLGLNDHTNSRTEGQIQGDMVTIMGLAAFDGKLRHQSTLLPRSDSSNGFVDVAGQTAKTDGTMSVLPTTNAYIRGPAAYINGQLFEVADIGMSARDSGVWAAPPAPTTDGVHPNTAMAASIAASLTLDAL